MDWKALIASQPALAPVPLALRDRAEVRRLGAGQFLFTVGDKLRGLFCVLSGEVRLVRRGRTGTEITLQRSRGGFIAEASLHSKAYHCDAVAGETGALVLRFPLVPFRTALDDDAHFRNAWMSLLAREVRKLRSQSERLSLRGAGDRVLHYLESEGTDGVVRLTQTRKQWAAELGLTHEALYRALSRLKAEGRVALEGNRIALNAPPPGRR